MKLITLLGRPSAGRGSWWQKGSPPGHFCRALDLSGHPCETTQLSELPQLPPEASSFVVLKGQVVRSLTHLIGVPSSRHNQVPGLQEPLAFLWIGHQPSSPGPASGVLMFTRGPTEQAVPPNWHRGSGLASEQPLNKGSATEGQC